MAAVTLGYPNYCDSFYSTSAASTSISNISFYSNGTWEPIKFTKCSPQPITGSLRLTKYRNRNNIIDSYSYTYYDMVIK